MANPQSWQDVTDKLDRAQKAKARKTRRIGPSEKQISSAIADAFRLKHRIILHETDAGGSGDKKGIIRCPQGLFSALSLPQALPFGMEAWLSIPPGFSDRSGIIPGVFIQRPTGFHIQRWIFVEVKAPGIPKFRPGQLEFLEARRAEGHIAFWASSVNSALDQFQEAIR